jgi:hypothetical protein
MIYKECLILYEDEDGFEISAWDTDEGISMLVLKYKGLQIRGTEFIPYLRIWLEETPQQIKDLFEFWNGMMK